jgi:hypothetical protein
LSLTFEQLFSIKKNILYNSRTKRNTTRRKVLKHVADMIIQRNIPANSVSTLMVLPPNTMRWDEDRQEYRSHESSCEFGQMSCSCWCNDKYHGLQRQEISGEVVK